MNTFNVTAASVVAIALAPIALAQECWTQWTANQHYYLLVRTPEGVTWQAAQNHAVALGGTLATITSAAENNFVFSRASDPTVWVLAQNPTRILGPWLGGFQPAGTAEPLGGWSWATGEAWSYANWHPNEPNNVNGNEEHLQFYTLGTVPAAKWNDLLATKPMLGYVVELEVVPPSNIADLNCDARVNGADLSLMLGNWGQTQSDSDLNGDGIVGPTDVAILLGEWGWPLN
jgi:hypothetical protein